jgi:threonine/homoserine/homoserine lactone efflux protein
VNAGWWVVIVIAVFGACFLAWLAWALMSPIREDAFGDEDGDR